MGVKLSVYTTRVKINPNGVELLENGPQTDDISKLSDICGLVEKLRSDTKKLWRTWKFLLLKNLMYFLTNTYKIFRVDEKLVDSY